jgi:NAD(P)-dependent dehydrogenase (short-subunit alcohol dehydrogenase family)
MQARMLPVTPSFRLDGKRALVTGASKGIGHAGAVALAAAGAEVVLAARTLHEMEQTVAELDAAGHRAKAVRLDVTERDAVRALVAAEGPFEALLNNAGTNIREPFLEVRDESLDTLLDLNIRAMFTVAQAVAQGMKSGGAILHLSSVNGHVGGTSRSVYTVSKHAIEGLTKAMAFELGPKGIRVNALAPGFVETPLTEGVLADPKFRDRIIRATPMARLATVEDVMGAIVFLLAPASAMITGHSLVVDGGMLTH